MSEYQYYEFAAIDRPLSVDEQADLRVISTRAQITPTSFVNHYEWGDLKADPRRLVERFFDAFLYLANWGTHRLMFRLPAEVLGASSMAGMGHYLVGDCSTAWTADEFVVIDLSAEDEDGQYNEQWLDGSGLLASIVPVRAELMAGDLRLLYLAWLLATAPALLDDAGCAGWQQGAQAGRDAARRRPTCVGRSSGRDRVAAGAVALRE